MKKMFATLMVAGGLLASPAYAVTGTVEEQVRTTENPVANPTAWVDSMTNYTNQQGLRGKLVGVTDLRMGTISSTVLYPGAAFTQFTFVFPNNVRKVKIQTHGGSSTNFCHVGWSSSLTGSKTDGNSIEAYQHLPRVGGAGGGVQDLALVAQSQRSDYEWYEIQTRGGFSTLYCGCTDTAAIGIDRISVEYYRP